MKETTQARLQTQDGVDMGVLGVKLSGELRGALFEACVEQRFYNPSDRHVEVVYSFPLPWGAVLLGVDVQLGGRHLSGAVVKKAEAEAEYEQALSEGDAAILLEKNRDHSYSLSLGNLAGQETCLITLRYAQMLPFSQGSLRLLIPTVIAPRYGDPVQDGGLRPHQAPTHSLLAEYPFELGLCLHGDLAQARVASPSHPVAFRPQADAEGPALTLSLVNQAYLDRDFVLVVDELPTASLALLARDSVRQGRQALLASFCPQIKATGEAHVAVKLLVDCSGSMAGDSMEAARRALQGIVGGLQKGDRFSLSRFGNEVQHRSRGLWQLTEATRRAALRWAKDLTADLGGTEMEAALRSTFELGQAGHAAQAADTVGATDVLLVTDGEINAIDGLLAAAVASGHRVFVVGIGSSPAEAHLRRLAEATGGACDFVAPGEAVEPAVLRMFARLRSPRLTDLRLVWPAGAQVEWAVPLPVSVFDGDTIHVLAWLGDEAGGELQLVGYPPGQAESRLLSSARLLATAHDVAALPRLVASAQAHSLAPSKRTEAGEVATVAVSTQEATQLALDYGLVTEWTNFLLTHQRSAEHKATDMPTLHKVAQMTPAGWAGTGTAMFSRRRLDSLDAPAAYRRGGANSIRFSIAASDVDVPAFLRRSKPKIDLNDDRHWSDTPHYKGLTPLGLSEWLRQTPKADWPGTLAELAQIGLGHWLIDWLELVVAHTGGFEHSEPDVVRAFTRLMASAEMRSVLARSEGVVAVVKGVAQRLRERVGGGEGDDEPQVVDTVLFRAMAMALQGVTAQLWPEAVFQMVEVGDGARNESASTVS